MMKLNDTQLDAIDQINKQKKFNHTLFDIDSVISQREERMKHRAIAEVRKLRKKDSFENLDYKRREKKYKQFMIKQANKPA